MYVINKTEEFDDNRQLFENVTQIEQNEDEAYCTYLTKPVINRKKFNADSCPDEDSKEHAFMINGRKRWLCLPCPAETGDATTTNSRSYRRFLTGSFWMGSPTAAERKTHGFPIYCLSSVLHPRIVFVGLSTALRSLKRGYCWLEKLSVDRTRTGFSKILANRFICKSICYNSNTFSPQGRHHSQLGKLSSITAHAYLKLIWPML